MRTVSIFEKEKLKKHGLRNPFGSHTFLSQDYTSLPLILSIMILLIHVATLHPLCISHFSDLGRTKWKKTVNTCILCPHASQGNICISCGDKLKSNQHISSLKMPLMTNKRCHLNSVGWYLDNGI